MRKCQFCGKETVTLEFPVHCTSCKQSQSFCGCAFDNAFLEVKDGELFCPVCECNHGKVTRAVWDEFTRQTLCPLE